MAESYQREIPKARVNISLDLHTGGAQKPVELPLKLLVMGDYSAGKEQAARPASPTCGRTEADRKAGLVGGGQGQVTRPTCAGCVSYSPDWIGGEFFPSLGC